MSVDQPPAAQPVKESAAQVSDVVGGAATIGPRTPVAADPVGYFAPREYGGKVLWEQMNEAYKHDPEVVPLYRQPDPRISEYRALLREASRALSAWHNFYGVWCNQPRMESALPPAGNVDLQERIAAALKEG